jgi:hypothetical protein
MDLFNWSLIAANEGPKVLMNKTITEDEPKSAFLVLSFLPFFFLPWELKWTAQIQVIRRRHLLPRIKHDISPFFPYCFLRFKGRARWEGLYDSKGYIQISNLHISRFQSNFGFFDFISTRASILWLFRLVLCADCEFSNFFFFLSFIFFEFDWLK